MTRGVRWYLVGSFVLVSLAGCGRGFFQSAEREPWRAEAEIACLKSGAVKENAELVRINPISGPGVWWRGISAQGSLHLARAAAVSAFWMTTRGHPATSATSRAGRSRRPLGAAILFGVRHAAAQLRRHGRRSDFIDRARRPAGGGRHRSAVRGHARGAGPRTLSEHAGLSAARPLFIALSGAPQRLRSAAGRPPAAARSRARFRRSVRTGLR